jgi:hypothetical protein
MGHKVLRLIEHHSSVVHARADVLDKEMSNGLCVVSGTVPHPPFRPPLAAAMKALLSQRAWLKKHDVWLQGINPSPDDLIWRILIWNILQQRVVVGSGTLFRVIASHLLENHLLKIFHHKAA